MAFAPNQKILMKA